MSNKRKLEEFHDPDYAQFSEAKKHKPSPQKVFVSAEERLEKIRSIVKREFQNELVQKEQEINKIESRILQAKRLLHRLRYAIVANFYSKKGMSIDGGGGMINQSDSGTTASTSNATTVKNETMLQSGDSLTNNKQRPIHPSLKKLIGKAPVDYDEILQFRPTPVRKAAQSAITSIERFAKKKKDDRTIIKTQNIPITETKSEVNELADRLKVPRYIEPIQKEKKIAALNSSRGRNQTRHLIAVGNTSKYIGDENSIDGVTHKWLVYVRAKTTVPIENFVQKVRFFLHPSYKPNDVVDVIHSPFQLSRRGWGEFPIRIQLYFNQNVSQKPLQIIHNLVLDRRMTGLQTMGAETVVELWLNLSGGRDGMEQTKTSLAALENTSNQTIVKSEVNYSDLEPMRIFNAPEKPGRSQSKTSSESIVNNTEVVHANTVVPELKTNDVSQSPLRKTTVVKIESPQKENPTVSTSMLPPILQTPGGKIEKLNTINKNGQIYVIDPNKKKTNRPKNQVSLLKPSLLKPQLNGMTSSTIPQTTVQYKNWMLSDHDYFGLNCKYVPPPLYTCKISAPPPPIPIPSIKITPMPITTHKNSTIVVTTTTSMTNSTAKKLNMLFSTEKSLDYRQILTSVFRNQTFTSIQSAVEFLLNKIPLTSSLVKKDSYRSSFPFTVESTTKFCALPTIKQINYEWLRAKMIQKLITRKYRNRSSKRDLLDPTAADVNVDEVIMMDGDESIWTTKEIFLFARKHGYIPYELKSCLKNERGICKPTNELMETINLKEMIKNEINREKQQSVSTITHNHRIYDWINKFVGRQLSTVCDDVLIDVITDVESNSKIRVNELTETATSTADKKLWLPMPSTLEKETQFVTEVCNEIGIRLQPEELIEGVIFPAAHRCLVQVVRHFVEDILRKAHAIKWDDENQSSTIPPSQNVGNEISVQDIRKAISNQLEYDILTLKHLGVSKIKANQ